MFNSETEIEYGEECGHKMLKKLYAKFHTTDNKATKPAHSRALNHRSHPLEHATSQSFLLSFIASPPQAAVAERSLRSASTAAAGGASEFCVQTPSFGPNLDLLNNKNS